MSLPSPSLRITGMAVLYSREYIQPRLREKRISCSTLHIIGGEIS
jgi:hypothetical protein